MQFSKCLTSKRTFWKHLGECSWQELVFWDRYRLEIRGTHSLIDQLLSAAEELLNETFFVFVFFFISINFVVFDREVETCCSRHLFGCGTENVKTAERSLPVFFFSSGLSLCSPNLAGCTVCVRVCVCPHAHGGTCTSLALSGVCISHQLVLMAGSQPCW